jgi:hypothetical protein
LRSNYGKNFRSRNTFLFLNTEALRLAHGQIRNRSVRVLSIPWTSFLQLRTENNLSMVIPKCVTVALFMMISHITCCIMTIHECMYIYIYLYLYIYIYTSFSHIFRSTSFLIVYYIFSFYNLYCLYVETST